MPSPDGGRPSRLDVDIRGGSPLGLQSCGAGAASAADGPGGGDCAL